MSKSLQGTVGGGDNGCCKSKRLDNIDNVQELMDEDDSLLDFIRGVRTGQNIITNISTVEEIVQAGDQLTTVINQAQIPDPLELETIIARIELRANETLTVGDTIDLAFGDLVLTTDASSTLITSARTTTYSSIRGDVNIVSNTTGTDGDINIVATSTGTSTVNITGDTINLNGPVNSTNINNNIAANGLIVSLVPPTPVVRQIDLDTATMEGGVLWYDSSQSEFRPATNDPSTLVGTQVLIYDNLSNVVRWGASPAIANSFIFTVDVNTVSKTTLGNQVPLNVSYAKLTLWGGGGGGGTISAIPAGAGGGGAGQGIFNYFIPLQGVGTYDVTVGGGGTGALTGSGSAGADGGNSVVSIGGLIVTAFGGAGGTGAIAPGEYTVGGGGGGTGSKGVGQLGGDATNVFPVKGPVGGMGGDASSPGVEGDVSLYVVTGGGGGGGSPSAATTSGFGANSGAGTIGGSLLDNMAQPVGGTGAGGMGANGASAASNSSGLSGPVNSGAGGSGGASNASTNVAGGDGGSGLVIVEFF